MNSLLFLLGIRITERYRFTPPHPDLPEPYLASIAGKSTEELFEMARDAFIDFSAAISRNAQEADSWRRVLDDLRGQLVAKDAELAGERESVRHARSLEGRFEEMQREKDAMTVRI